MNLDETIRKYALQNAVKFKGKANPGAIIGKLFAEDPSLKQKAKEVSGKIQEILKEVHALSVEEQQKELEEKFPEMLEKKEKKERNIFSFLKLSEGVVTAFPPGPEKYPHIGHAKAILLNYLAAKQYKGKFILRFEDTNPNTTKKEYYDAMLEGFSWLGIKWNDLIYASDHMDYFYEKCEQLLSQGDAYVDTSNGEDVKKSREKGIATSSRSTSSEENLKLWKEMSSMKEGSAIVRLKIDLKHQNTTMRDPTIFRIITEEHARQKKKYAVWPTYDFQNSLMDSYSNVDMRLRSKEFELRSELQRWIQEKLSLKLTGTYEFGRFNMKGVESSGRIIREKVEGGELIGWDDPSLTTLAALKRRGFLPEAIKNFVLSTGISKAEATMTWDDLIVQNKRLLDATASRYSAIFDPKEVVIKGAPTKKVELHLNPNDKKGGRTFSVTQQYILSKKDLTEENIRLMDCINVRKEKDNYVFDSESYKEFSGKKVVNWLPLEGNVEIEVLMPDKTIMKGLSEHTISKLKEGDVIQFERFGFCRLDNKKEMKFWYTHK